LVFLIHTGLKLVRVVQDLRPSSRALVCQKHTCVSMSSQRTRIRQRRNAVIDGHNVIMTAHNDSTSLKPLKLT